MGESGWMPVARNDKLRQGVVRELFRQILQHNKPGITRQLTDSRRHYFVPFVHPGLRPMQNEQLCARRITSGLHLTNASFIRFPHPPKGRFIGSRTFVRHGAPAIRLPLFQDHIFPIEESRHPTDAPQSLATLLARPVLLKLVIGKWLSQHIAGWDRQDHELRCIAACQQAIQSSVRLKDPIARAARVVRGDSQSRKPTFHDSTKSFIVLDAEAESIGVAQQENPGFCPITLNRRASTGAKAAGVYPDRRRMKFPSPHPKIPGLIRL